MPLSSILLLQGTRKTLILIQIDLSADNHMRWWLAKGSLHLNTHLFFTVKVLLMWDIVNKANRGQFNRVFNARILNASKQLSWSQWMEFMLTRNTNSLFEKVTLWSTLKYFQEGLLKVAWRKCVISFPRCKTPKDFTVLGCIEFIGWQLVTH